MENPPPSPAEMDHLRQYASVMLMTGKMEHEQLKKKLIEKGLSPQAAAAMAYDVADEVRSKQVHQVADTKSHSRRLMLLGLLLFGIGFGGTFMGIGKFVGGLIVMGLILFGRGALKMD